MTLRVALVHSFYSSREPSGENAQVEAEMQALARAGLDVRLFAAHTDDKEDERFYRTRSALRVATGRGRSPLGAVTSFEPDVVHVHNLFPNFGRRWVRELEAPVVATLHNYRFVCSAASLFRDGHICTDCPDGKPWSALHHRCYRGSAAATAPLVIAQRGSSTADPLLARADRILCILPRQRQLLERDGVDPNRIYDWSNFLPAHLTPRPTSSRRRGCLYVGRLTEEKGIVDLVANWRGEMPLTVIGDGALRPAVERAAEGRNVTVLGTVPRSRVIELMWSSTALALPSIWPEATPLTAIEAMACGLPIVVHAGSDTAALVTEHGVGAAVASASEFSAAAGSLAEELDVSLRCRSLFEKRFTEEAWTKRTVAVYRQAAALRNRSSDGGAP